MNQTTEWRTVRIGLLVAAALVVLALFIMGITSQQRIFERKVEYMSRFPDAAGLKVSSSVWFQGVEVGFITSIEFNEDPEVQEVIVRYRISSSLVPRIRTGTRASIKSLGLLGDKYLALMTPKDARNEVNIPPGHEIPVDPALNLEQLGKGAQDVMNSAVEISQDLRNILESINSGEGAVSMLLHDPVYGQETLGHIQNVAKNLDVITTQVAGGQGLTGRMLTDSAYGEKTSRDIAESLARVNGILAGIEEGKGGMGAFLEEGGEGENAIKSLSKASDLLAGLVESLGQEGTFGSRVLLDPVYGDRLAGNLMSITDSLSSILKKVDSGEGTLGSLVNNPEIYESLKAVVEALEKGKLAKWYLRRNVNKSAEKAWAEEQGQEAKTP